MHTVQQSSLLSQELQNFFKANGEAHATTAAKIRTKTNAKTDLTIVTADGDKVTLSTKSSLRTAYTTYDARGLHGPSSVHGEALKISARDKLSVVVEGNLSAEERADIERLLGHITGIASDLLTGNLDKAALHAFDISDLDSIASFGAKLRFEQRVNVSQLSTKSASGTPAPVRAPETAKAQPSASIGIDHVIDDMIQAVQDSKVSEGRFAHRLPGFVSELFEKLADELELDASRRKLAVHLASRFRERFKLTVRASEPEAKDAAPIVKVNLKTKASQRVRLTAKVGPQPGRDAA